MSDRLRHLQRQQTLLREHLAWIEAEIARESTSTPPPLLIPAAPPATPANQEPSPTPELAPTPKPAARLSDSSQPAPTTDSTSALDVDELIQRFAAEEHENPEASRRGCLLIFGTSLLLLVSIVALVWIIYYRH